MMKSFSRRGRTTALASGLVLAGAVLAQGCLQREVNPQKPNTSNVFVEQIANTAINEIDLLFVIDNSVSMADKQDILKLAVPQMVQRLVSPACVDADGNPVGANTDANGECPGGAGPEFTPVDDIHIGVITSSLGGHGAQTCVRNEANANSPSGFWDNDDQGYLVPHKRPNATVKGVTTPAFPNGAGFLAWNGGGDAERQTLIDSFTEHVDVAGEFGCGFEAPLEAWYRFLVDPQPPADIQLDGNKVAVSTGIDETLLAQRNAFLRPQGLVAIVVLTDENDCSVMDGGDYYNNAGFGYLVSTVTPSTFTLPVATSVCETNPNDACCFSCLQKKSPPSGCGSFVAECDGDPVLAPEADRANARCFENKRRFGVDLLYPVSRYVDALSSPLIIDARTGDEAPNPLLRGAGENAGKPRDPGLVFFAGIVGVPWQDIATADSLDPNSATMEYLTAVELSQKSVDVGDRKVDRWEVILGQPGLSQTSKRCNDDVSGCGDQPKVALDPFMIESITPRIGNDVYGQPIPAANPISGDLIVGSDSTNPQANNINGHEANHDANDVNLGGPGNDDLQYACIFKLAPEAEKTNCGEEGSGSCDCGDEPARNRPLCNPPGGGVAEKNQYYGKAYPGTRILQVLKEFGANSIVGSICPKVTTGSAAAAGFGYNPAVQAIVDRLAEKLSGKCLPRELTIDDEGDVPCAVVEAKPQGADEPLDCAGNGRKEVEPDIRPAVEKQLADTGFCDGDSDISCSTYQMCEIEQLPRGSDGRTRCFTDPLDAASFPEAGYCYIDPAKGPEAGGVPNAATGGCDADDPNSWADCTNEIVANCPATERRLLRFAGANTPASDSITFVACTGDAATSDAAIPKASAQGAGGATN